MSLEGLENTWLWLDNPVNTHEGYNRMEKSHVPGSGQPREVIPFTRRCSPTYTGFALDKASTR